MTADRVRFFFDFLCPWCYQTSLWIRQLQDLGEVEVSWGLFSLELANAEPGEASIATTAKGAMALRTTAVLRDVEGDQAVGAFYATLGAAIHERGEDVTDPDVVGSALEAIGVPSALVDKALGDPASWDVVEREHRTLVERTRSFGVPTIVLDDGHGPAIFGPVISEVPEPDDAVELWRHVSWLTRYENLSELKRDRTIEPDLESYRRFMAARRA
jgi:predicted DsbA family dithiol-disulfide isomerase